jgi:S-adenosylmethionine:tRNA ribosyltransferase-isomerase
MYDIKDYQYELPPDLIAQKPLSMRDSSRLMVIERRTGLRTHCLFSDLAELLRAGDMLVINNTAVVPARLIGTKETGGKVEVLLIDYPDRVDPGTGAAAIVRDCLIKAARRPKPGSRLNFGNRLQGTVLAELDGKQRIAFSGPDDVESLLERVGRVPLPPYIRNGIDDDQDRVRYQTVYASVKGAVAAPTAGLHFTDALLDQLRRIGVDIVALTLHVGYGTFAPVRVDDIRQHRMHSEPVTIPESTANAVNAARDEGRRIIAVGTTSVRSLEFAAAGTGRIQPGQHHCDLFIYPGYRFRIVDAMITNFHLPGSTLLMLVSAFAGRERILSAYAGAIRRRYRFYSYGDAMLIL